MKKYSSFISILSIFVVTFSFVSCKKSYKTVTIWTDQAELVSYAELFNSQHEYTKAVVVYKEYIPASLPLAKDEKAPDIIIGSWLKNKKLKKNFAPISNIFGKNKIPKNSFYESMLNYGKFGTQQYLLPVSFNLPVIIFSSKNESFVNEDFTLTIKQIMDIAGGFNDKNKKGIFTNMGFAPSWDPAFLYTAAKLSGVDFSEKNGEFVWNKDKLEQLTRYIKAWSSELNESTVVEQDFAFKYLYTPSYKQIALGRCLFSYTTSNKLFSLLPEQIEDTDFRWLSDGKSIIAEDDITMLALYKKSRFSKTALDFIKWFFTEENQKEMMQRIARMNLNTNAFGIANGFSALKTMNEHNFHLFYKSLIGNLPPEEFIQAPQELPSRWESLKSRVVVPYLADVTNTNLTNIQSMEDRLNAWSKQFN